MVTGDFNGDGKLDLAACDNNNNSLVVALGNADGTFQSLSVISVDQSPWVMVARDFDGDGKTDLAVGRISNKSVRIFRNFSNGSFATTQDYATSSSPMDLQAGDVTGDGKTDLILPDSDHNAVEILPGRGDGTFGAALSVALPGSPSRLGLGDFNADGKTDLVVTCNDGINGIAHVMLNQGSGNFVTGADMTMSLYAWPVNVADFNGDGKLDLVVSDVVGDNFKFYAGQGNGTFLAPVRFDCGTQAMTLASGDFNGDGKIDLMVGYYYEHFLSFYMGQTNGTFTYREDIPPSEWTPTNYRPMATGDFNRDGKLDLVVANFYQGALTFPRLDIKHVAVETPSSNANLSEGALLATSISFVDPLAATTWSAQIDYGDGSALQNLTLNAATSFNLNHAYADNGSYTIVISVSNAGGYSGSATFGATVTNANPTATFGNGGAVAEGSTGTVNFTNANDPGSADVTAGFKYSYDFNNDGTFEISNSTSASVTVPATYLSDGPGTRVVRGRIIDKDGGYSDYTTTLTINNANPTASFGNGGAVAEGSTGTVNFTNVSDPSSVDVVAGFKYSFDFNNDGTFEITDSTSASATVPAIYLAEGPGTRVVRGRISDKDGGYTDYTTTLTITNVAPTASLGNGGSVTEGSTGSVAFTNPFDLSATDTAAGFKYSFDFNNDGTFEIADSTSATATVPAIYLADGAGSRVVRGRISDKDGGYSDYTTTLTITNVNPTATFGNGGAVAEGSTGTVNFTSASDPSSADVTAGFKYSYDFNNDGTFEISNSTSASVTVPASYLVDGPGTRVVRGRIIDKDGGYSDYTTTLTINNANPTASFTSGGPVLAGSAGSVSFTHIADASSGDMNAGFKFSYDFNNDGIFEISNSTSAVQTVPEKYLGLGQESRVIRGRITDRDGGFSDYTTSITVLKNGLSFGSGAKDLSTGAGPSPIVKGDFNNDGNEDLAVANSTDGSVSIFLGRGDGSFAVGNIIATGQSPMAMVSGDFNQDGRVDLAVSNFESGTVSILLGRGDGTFQAKTDISGVDYPMDIVAGDFNADGKLDLAVSSFFASSVNILLGQGNGGFATPRATRVGDYPTSLRAADFDGDGRLDLVVATLSNPDEQFSDVSCSLKIWKGTGSGYFNYASQSDIVTRGFEQETGDFNGDGKVDLMVLDYQTNTVRVLTGGGNGTFSYGAGIKLDGAVGRLYVVDLNADNRQDLLVSEGGDAADIRELFGTGDGTFSDRGTYPVTAEVAGLVAGDFNRDGVKDIAGSLYESNAIHLFLGQRQAAAALTLTGAGSVNNGEIYTFRGKLSRSSAEGYALQIDWNDGTSSLASVEPGATEFSVDHRYARSGQVSALAAKITVTLSDSLGILSTASQALTIGVTPPRLFDEAFYLARYPDVRGAVQAGVFASGYEHFLRAGQHEGRAPDAYFNEAEYLRLNPDVAQAVQSGAFASGFEHFTLFGQQEARAFNWYFKEADYLAFNPDVAAAVRAGVFTSGFEHFYRYGQHEGRTFNWSYNEASYLASNPDVASAVNAGAFASGFEHFWLYGQREGRTVSWHYNEAFYLAANPDVAAVVQAGGLASGLEHFMRYGLKEGRPCSAFFDEAYYLAHNADVAGVVSAGGVSSGLEHFLRYGISEHRSGSPLFDEAYYLLQNPDVAAAVGRGALASGFEHFVRFGYAEHRLSHA